MERYFKLIFRNATNGARSRFLVPVNATAPYSNDIRTFMEDSEDYHADYYEGYRHHSSVNLFKTTTQKPHPHPPPHLTKPRDIFSEHEFLYVFNICLVLIFLLQVVLIYLCLARRRFRNRFRADLEAMQVQFHAGGGAGNNFGVGGHPGIGGFVTGAAPAG